jgi:hypothetical protein
VRAVVFALAGSPSIEQILAELRGRRWPTSLALRDLPTPRIRPGRSIRHLFLRDTAHAAQA